MTNGDGNTVAAERLPLHLRLRHGAEWLALAGALALVRVVPLSVMTGFMGRAWRLFGPLNKRHRRALQNLARAFPEKTDAEREAIARDMWDNLGRIAAETLSLDRLVADPARFDIDVEAVRAHVGDRGAVVVSMHSGNWEIATLGGLAAGWETIGLYKQLNNPRSEALLRGLREPIYPGGLLPKGHEAARRLLSMVRRGGRAAMLADLRDRRGAVFPFFGHDAFATTYPASIACAAGVPLVACRVLRLPGNRFRITAEVVNVPLTGARKADALALTRRYHEIFEGWIRETPAQWMWIMRKWV